MLGMGEGDGRGGVGPPPSPGSKRLLTEAAEPARVQNQDTWGFMPTFPPTRGVTEPPVSPRVCLAPFHLHKYHECVSLGIISAKLTLAVSAEVITASLPPVNIPETEEVHFLRSRQEPWLALPINN